MIQKIFSALMSGLLSLTGCFGDKPQQIRSIHSFSEVRFDSISNDTLVVFDVDETLIQPLDASLLHLGSPQSIYFLRKMFEKHPEVSDEAWIEMIASMGIYAERSLIEPNIITVISHLQQQNVPVIACTSMRFAAPHGKWQNTCEWRYEHLKSLGFEGSYSDRIIQFNIDDRSSPIFYKGILVSDRASKGLVIGAFLDTLNLQPKEIIMFDDNGEYLLSVYTECAKRGIIFKGYHYNGALKRFHEIIFDESIATIQVEHLIKHGIWLSDEQIHNALQNIDFEQLNLITTTNPTNTAQEPTGQI